MMGTFLAFVIGVFVPSQTLSPKSVNVGAFDVIGIECRTNNVNEASPTGCIGQQWKHLMSEGLLSRIPHRADNRIVAVYTNYASDKNGDYTYILGAKVDPGTSAPLGMVTVRVKAGRFAVFTTDKGPVQQMVVAAWKRIWETGHSQLGGDRLYESDFELYDERASDPANAQVDIFIRVR